MAATSSGIPRVAGDGAVREVMRGLRRVLRARRADEARHHAIDGDAVAAKVMRERAGETDDAGLGGDDMGAVLGAAMGAEAADVDDGAPPRSFAAPARQALAVWKAPSRVTSMISRQSA